MPSFLGLDTRRGRVEQSSAIVDPRQLVVIVMFLIRQPPREQRGRPRRARGPGHVWPGRTSRVHRSNACGNVDGFVPRRLPRRQSRLARISCVRSFLPPGPVRSAEALGMEPRAATDRGEVDRDETPGSETSRAFGARRNAALDHVVDRARIILRVPDRPSRRPPRPNVGAAVNATVLPADLHSRVGRMSATESRTRVSLACTRGLRRGTPGDVRLMNLIGDETRQLGLHPLTDARSPVRHRRRDDPSLIAVSSCRRRYEWTGRGPTGRDGRLH